MTSLGITADLIRGWTLEQHRTHIVGQLVDAGVGVRLARTMVEAFEQRVRYEATEATAPAVEVPELTPKCPRTGCIHDEDHEGPCDRAVEGGSGSGHTAPLPPLQGRSAIHAYIRGQVALLPEAERARACKCGMPPHTGDCGP